MTRCSVYILGDPSCFSGVAAGGRRVRATIYTVDKFLFAFISGLVWPRHTVVDRSRRAALCWALGAQEGARQEAPWCIGTKEALPKIYYNDEKGRKPHDERYY